MTLHQLAIPTPFRVGPRQLLPGRGRPAHAGRHGPELGRVAQRARVRAAEHGTGSRTSSGSCSPTSTPTTSGWSASSPSAPAPRCARSTCSSPVVEDFGGYAEANDVLAQALMRATGSGDMVTVLGATSRASAAGAGARPSRTSCTTARTLAFAGRALAAQHRPGHSPSDTVFWDAATGDADRRRPPDREHLLQSADLAPLGGRSGEPGGRAPAGAADLPRVAARDARDAGQRSCPATASRSTARGADRRALRDARAPRREDPRADRGAAAHRARDRADDVGQRRGHPGLPDAERGARPHRPAARAREVVEERATTATCSSLPRR